MHLNCEKKSHIFNVVGEKNTRIEKTNKEKKKGTQRKEIWIVKSEMWGKKSVIGLSTVAEKGKTLQFWKQNNKLQMQT